MNEFFDKKINEIINNCIIHNEERAEEKRERFFSERLNYSKKLGEETFISFYESLSLDEQKAFIVKIIGWAAPSSYHNKGKADFLKAIAKPVFIHCLNDQQSKGMYAVPIDLFSSQLKSFLEELKSAFPMLEKLQKYDEQLNDLAFLHHTDIIRRPTLVELNLGSEASVDGFIAFAEQFNHTQLKQSELNQGILGFDPEVIPYASELFQTKAKPTVVLKVNNFSDGVGDAQTFFAVAESSKKVLERKGYRIVGLLELMGGGGKAQEIRAYIKQALETSNPFDMLYIMDNNPINQRIAFPGLEGRIMVSGEERPQSKDTFIYTTECRDTASKDIKENAVLYINILFDNITLYSGAQGNVATLANSLTPAGLVLDVGELGQIPAGRHNFKNKNHYLSSNLGLPSKAQEDIVNGLLLRPQISQEQLVDVLKQFKNQKYIRALLRCEKISQHVLREYQKTHIHMIGYLQTTSAGNLYILSNILRYYDKETRVLCKSCDIHLNAAAIDKQFLQKAFESLEVSGLEFVTPHSLGSQQQDMSPKNRDECSIRIFTGFQLDHDDYQALYSISEEPAGCSGDNSFSDAGQRRLPFPGIISDDNQFASSFAKKQLLEFTKAHNFNALHDYFKKVTDYSQQIHNPNELSACFEIAEQLKSETLWQEWKAFSTLLKEKYNYFDNFPGILDKCLRQVSKNTELLEKMHQCLISSSYMIKNKTIG